MKDKVLAAIAEYGMLRPGDFVLVGVSGGADSMCLLHFLCSQAASLGVTVAAAHLNHCLRGEEAERDEAHVRRWCAQEGIPLAVERQDIAALAQEKGLGVEACGREARYAFFSRVAAPGAKIATAHTLSDSMETFLLNLARGAGTTGLCGIPPVRGAVIRPLIRVTRPEVEEYCRRNGVPYVQDSTNGSLDYARNRVRHNVLPALFALNPSLPRALSRAMRRMEQDEAYFAPLAARALEGAAAGEEDEGYVVPRLLALEPAVQSRALLLAARQAGAQPEEAHIVRMAGLLAAGAGALDLPGGVRARVRGGLLYFSKQGAHGALPVSDEIALAPPQRLVFCNKPYQVALFKRKDFLIDEKIHKMLFTNCLDYDTISGRLVLRGRRAGDCFSPCGRGVAKSLKNLFQEAGIPAEKRPFIPLLCAGSEIVWIEGFGPAQGAQVTGRTQKILCITPEGAYDKRYSKGPDQRGGAFGQGG